MNLKKHNPSLDSSLFSQEERRKSQRVTLRVGVRLLVTSKGDEKVIEAFTVNVNDHGALLICPHSFAVNDRITMEHKHTRNRIACRVTRKSQEASSGYQVAIEFEQASPNFWQIAFPPLDWKPTD